MSLNQANSGDAPRVSVVMPVYNAAEYVGAAITSILTQTFRDLELIVIDDGSTDGTNEVIESLAKSDHRLISVNQENSGIVAALNRGLELARGELIARMDADDISRPDRLEKQVDLMERRHQVVACGTDATLIGDGRGRYRMPSTNSSCRAMLLLRPCFIHPSVMFRRSVIDAGVRYRPKYQFVEDYDLWLRLRDLGELANIREALLAYRVHRGQTGNTRRSQQAGLHLDLSFANLSKAGISVDKGNLTDVLFSSEASPLRKIKSAFVAMRVLFLMALRGWFRYKSVI